MSVSGSTSSYIERYRAWAARNPGLVKDVQTFLKGLSYFLTGYLKESVLLSEFVFSAAQLLSLTNKRILAGNVSLSKSGYERLEDFLRVFGCLEVFLEIATLRLAGPLARWAVIFCVQVVKTTIRILLLHRKGMMLEPLDVEDAVGVEKELTHPADQQQTGSQESAQLFFTLKSSGRVIRKIQGASSHTYRRWMAPSDQLKHSSSSPHQTLNSIQLLAEYIYAVKPIAHLMALGLMGENAWSPFILALSMDCFSQGLHMTSCQTIKQRRQVLKRWLALLGYILRSPFYDQKSKSVILCFLGVLERNLPVGSSLVSSIKTYLPDYQKIYFYVW